MFLILIAVALFAALSYAVTQSGRGSGSTSRETASLAVSTAINYFSLLQSTVDRLVVLGCAKEEICYAGGPPGVYTNVNAPTDESCHVFSASGGNLDYIAPPAGILDASHSAESGYGNLLLSRQASFDTAPVGGGTDCTNYILIPFVSNDACLALNRMNGHGSIPASTQTNTGLNLYGVATFNKTTPLAAEPFQDGGYTVECDVNGYDVAGSQSCGGATGCVRLADFAGIGSPVNIIYHAVMRNADVCSPP